MRWIGGKEFSRRTRLGIWFFARRSWRAVAAVAVMWTAVAMLVVQPAEALPVCHHSFSTCCEITSGGTYSLTSSISTSASTDCIVVNAASVSLYLDGNNVQSSANSGIGVHVMPTASAVVVVGGGLLSSIVSGFATGLENDAPGTLVYDFATENNHLGIVNSGANAIFLLVGAQSNTGNGIVISNGTGVRLNNFETDSNTGNGVVLYNASGAVLSAFDASSNFAGVKIYGGGSNTLASFTSDNNRASGVWIDGGGENTVTAFDSSNNSEGAGIQIYASNHNSISGYAGLGSPFTANGNGRSGVYIGCSASATPSSVTCASMGLPPSNGNSVLDGEVGNNSSAGVGIDKGNGGNKIVSVSSSGNHPDDSVDDNPTCVNVFLNDSFTTSTGPC